MFGDAGFPTNVSASIGGWMLGPSAFAVRYWRRAFASPRGCWRLGSDVYLRGVLSNARITICIAVTRKKLKIKITRVTNSSTRSVSAMR
jgi:hypothetical protein